MQRKPIRLALVAPASASDKLERKIYRRANLERLVVFFPPGPMGDLRLIPKVRYPNGDEMNLIQADDAGLALDYLEGDDYRYEFLISLALPRYSVLVLEYNNTDAVYEHFFDSYWELIEHAEGDEL
jgi:hypothetical protein